MRLLPSIEFLGSTHCEIDGEYEGKTLIVWWGPWQFELALRKKERSFGTDGVGTNAR